MTDPKIIQERMAQGFVPAPGTTEQRLASAAEYIAFHLGRIDKSLSDIAAKLPETK